MKIQELAQEKIGLEMRLQAIAQTNIYGMDFEKMVALELDNIQTIKRLNEVKAEISEYCFSLRSAQ